MGEHEKLDDLCADGTCVIDTEALKKRAASVVRDQRHAVLIFLTRGTYGRYDDGFSGIQMGSALLAMEVPATMLLLDEGVYYGVRGQNPRGLGLPNSIHYIEDFLELEGRILALRSSLEKRGLHEEDLVEGIQIIDSPQMAKELASHRVSLTF
jgi:sulfur relay (sulfurtransferase) DsrF/TusC family protein